LVTQRPPARIIVDADLSCETQLITQSLSCEAPSYNRGAHGSEGALSYIAGLVAATAVATEALKPVGKRGNDTAECEDRSPDFFVLGIWPLLYFFGYVSTKDPVAQLVARITISLLALKTFEQR
ncbi:unnamed protein product, partial [Penicillium salamii]